MEDLDGVHTNKVTFTRAAIFSVMERLPEGQLLLYKLFSSHQLQVIKDHFQYLVPRVKMFTPKDRQSYRKVQL